MTIAYKDDLATLNPAIGYDWTNWPAEKMVFDALLDTTTRRRSCRNWPLRCPRSARSEIKALQGRRGREED